MKLIYYTEKDRRTESETDLELVAHNSERLGRERGMGKATGSQSVRQRLMSRRKLG